MEQISKNTHMANKSATGKPLVLSQKEFKKINDLLYKCKFLLICLFLQQLHTSLCPNNNRQ